MRGFCPPALPAGINPDCLNFPAPLDLPGLAASNLEFDTLDDIKNPDTWIELVQELDLWVPGDNSSYNDTTPDPTINTTQKNKQLLVRPGVPSFQSFIESNVCDFNSVLGSVNGGVYGVPLFLEDQSVMVRQLRSGKFGLMKARVNSVTKGITSPDVIEESFPMYFNFINYKQFLSRRIVPLDFDIADELVINSPLGYTIDPTDEPTAGVGNFYISKNCGAGEAGFLTADVEIIDSNVTTPVAALVDNLLGAYEITFTKGEAAALAASDWIRFRIKVESSDIVSKISNIYTLIQE